MPCVAALSTVTSSKQSPFQLFVNAPKIFSYPGMMIPFKYTYAMSSNEKLFPHPCVSGMDYSRFRFDKMLCGYEFSHLRLSLSI